MEFKRLNSMIKDYYKLYKVVKKTYSNTSILESLGTMSKNSRYTIIGVISKEILFEENNIYYLKKESRNPEEVNWLDVIDGWVENLGKSNTPYQLGAIGYIGYDIKDYFENIQKKLERDSDVPYIYMVKYKLLFVWDRTEENGCWIYEDESLINEIKQIEGSYENYTLLKISESFNLLGDLEPNFTKEQYIDSINKNIDYIKKGDIFQANITMRFSGNYSGDVFVLYDELRKKTPNPYFAFFDFKYPFISTSPEAFFEIKDNKIISCPIKGTVRCVLDGKDQKENLENDIKNRAENVMIADLIRNDIGRVCKIGSVNVDVLCGVKKFNNLYHMESIISGELDENIAFSKVMQYNFPGGSITGAPKVRSMEIIEELEYTERNVYCGLIGFLGCNGYVNTSIGIRIVYFDDKKLYFHAGGGITIKSNAEDEYRELMLKVELMRNTINSFNVLNEMRSKIDEIDSNIIMYLDKRFGLIREISEIKKLYGISVMQSDRVKNIINRISTITIKENTNISSDFLKKLYLLIIEQAMNIEKEV